MTFRYNFVEPSGQGNLGKSIDIKWQLRQLSGFRALFIAGFGEVYRNFSARRIREWRANEGSAKFIQDNESLQPMDGRRGNIRIQNFSNDSSLSLEDEIIGAATDYTIGVRLYQKNRTRLGNQFLFGQNPSSPPARLYANYNNQNVHSYHLQYGDTGGERLSITLPDRNDWHSIIIAISNGTLKMAVDRSDFETVSTPILNLPQFFIGHSVGHAGDADMDFRSMALFEDDVTDDPEDLETLWRALEVL